MTSWATWRVEYSEADEIAFGDPLRINSHYGLPLSERSHVFSRSLNDAGLSNVHDPGKKYRPHYFGNNVAIRHIKARHPDAWIWDERYRFTRDVSFAKDERIIHAQREFIQKMGLDRITEVRAMALAAGLDPEGKIVGRPDLAVFMPGGSQMIWRFIEIKIRDRGDSLGENQTKWLQFLADCFGRESAVEMELVKRDKIRI